MKFFKICLTAVLALALLISPLPVFAAEYQHNAHQALALEAAGEGIVLLKNKNSALPLAKNERVALFGDGQLYMASTSSGYQIGGGGSGWVDIQSSAVLGPVDAFLAAQAQGKIAVYQPLVEAYKNDITYVPTEAMYQSAASFADTAILFITRYSTEGTDISVADWSLSEKELLMMQTLSARFEKLIVLLNTPSVIGTAWSVDGNAEGIDVDALLACYFGGEKGAEAMVEILLGEVNPSGKLTHTYAKDIYSYPTTETFLENRDYVNYTEDIYVGYRYFETFAKDEVVYPFGYGLSYTTFSICNEALAVENGTVTVTVTVQNTGTVAGKEVVQVYYSAPQMGNGSAVLSKSAICLAAYPKTALLQPGESQTLTISYPISYMASFDDTGKTGNAGAYVLEAGLYDILVGNSVRHVQSAGGYTVTALTVASQQEAALGTTLQNRLTADGSYEVISEKSADTVYVSASSPSFVEAERGMTAAGSGINTYETYHSSNAFLYNGSKYVALFSGRVLGNMNQRGGQTVKYKLTVEEAGVYTVGFVASNGTDTSSSLGGFLNAENIIDFYVSTNDELGVKQPISLDVKNTRNVGTGAYWFNFIYSTTDLQGNTYTLDLPAGEVTLTFYLTANINTGVTPNIDKFVLIPAGATCTVEDVCNTYFIPQTGLDIDMNASLYTGITYADVAAGKATLEALIAQMSYAELVGLCYGHTAGLTSGTGSIGFASNATAEKYGIYAADTADGPAGLRLSTLGCVATFWPCSTLMASTWNQELLLRVGVAIGEECLRYNADIWLAPGMNLHRNPLCGRNFEYYSEEPVVAGNAAAAVVNGVESQGVGCAIKHFVANNKEDNRFFSDSRVSEKAMRELYLKGFEIAVEKADPMCIMTSYNMLNDAYTSTTEALLRGIVRGEWGYEGLIMSDWWTTPSVALEVLAGNNVTMPVGEVSDLEVLIQSGVITRAMLEENAAYILRTLVQLPDHTLHLGHTVEISATAPTTITADQFSKKAYMTKFEVMDKGLCATTTEYKDETDGSYGFVEFRVQVSAAGEYALALDYATIYDVSKAYKILVNGETVANIDANVQATGDWSKFVQKPIGTVHLEAGVSTIRIQHSAAKGVNYGALITTPVVALQAKGPSVLPYVLGGAAACLAVATGTLTVLQGRKRKKQATNS